MLSFVGAPSLPTRSRHTSNLHPFICAASPPPPTSLSGALSLATPALTALTSSAPRPYRAKLRLLIPGLNPLLEDTFPYSDPTLCDAAALTAVSALSAFPAAPAVALLFKSAGTAAAAQAYYTRSAPPGRPSELPAEFPSLLSAGRVVLGSFAGRDAARPTAESAPPPYPRGSVVVLVNPASARGDPVVEDVRKLVARGEADAEPAAAHILINPEFDADVSALGMADRSSRVDFLSSFVEVLYLRTLAEIVRPTLVAREVGALLRIWPNGYSIWRTDGNGVYDFVRDFNDVPSRSQITDALVVPAVARKPGEGREFGEEDRAFLGTLLALSVFASGAFYVLRVAGAS